jgi:LCP family protein required for cell wall assembly
MMEETKPSTRYGRDWEPFPPNQPLQIEKPKKRRGCSAIFLGLVFGILITVYLLAPTRTNILLLGIDRAPEGTDVARTDTIILTTIIPLKPYIGMLSIPRDLWVLIPGVGENRINTAHFFAESTTPGAGPSAAMDTVASNFGVDVDHYVRFRFESLVDFVDAFGGVQISLDQTMAGYPPGDYRLDGEKALAFVRDRSGTDDFFRMSNGQLFAKALLQQVMRPANWIHLPRALFTLAKEVDTDIPLWKWPRIAVALLRSGSDGIDTRIISRQMTSGFTTDQGAQVLAPDWSQINPLLWEMFGQ